MFGCCLFKQGLSGHQWSQICEKSWSFCSTPGGSGHYGHSSCLIFSIFSLIITVKSFGGSFVGISPSLSWWSRGALRKGDSTALAATCRMAYAIKEACRN
jgi:hypothetical protein